MSTTRYRTASSRGLAIDTHSTSEVREPSAVEYLIPYIQFISCMHANSMHADATTNPNQVKPESPRSHGRMVATMNKLVGIALKGELFTTEERPAFPLVIDGLEVHLPLTATTVSKLLVVLEPAPQGRVRYKYSRA